MVLASLVAVVGPRILNKYAMLVFPYAGFLTAFQFLSSGGAVWMLGKMGQLEVEGLHWPKVKVSNNRWLQLDLSL